MADLASSIINMSTSLRGDFFELVKAIGECRSKQEEDRIVVDEIAVLKAKMSTQATFSKKMKEYLVRLIYCEMLGHDASFGYIKAVELCASSNLLQKRVGYLTASLCLAPDHEFRFMLVNQFTRDMASINYLEVCAALNAVCRLATVDTIPALLSEVTSKLRHEQEAVRKKAVMALHRFHKLQPGSIAHLDDRIRRALCDKDPSVMAAVLCLLLDLISASPAPYRDLVPSFVSILKQIVDHRLPRDYDYHRVPAPWVQMHLLRILALLGASDQRSSEGMYEVLIEVMRRADTGINVGYAIVYECVRTVTTIYPNTVLLDTAAGSIARFIGSDNHNLKYLGIKGLASIVKDHPRYASQHQLAVIDCLEDPDETLKRKTLDLLYRMTNPVNVEFIIAKLLEYLEKATDPFLRSDLVHRISHSAERYAPSTSWYIQTMTRIFLLAGDLVKLEAAHTLMQLIAEGTGEDDEADEQLRRDAVENYTSLLLDDALKTVGGASLPDILVQTMSWTLGEYGYLSKRLPQSELIEYLAADIAHRPFVDPCTRGFVVAAVVKLVAQTGSCPVAVSSLIALYSQSRNLDLQQRCLEYTALLQAPSLLVDVLPVDASCEDLDVDESLPFLESFVQAAIARGAPRYCPPPEYVEVLGLAEGHQVKGPGLKLAPYAKPAHTLPGAVPGSLLAGLSVKGASLSTSSPSSGPNPVCDTGSVAKQGLRPVAQIWSRQGAVHGPKGVGTPNGTRSTTVHAATAPTSSLGLSSGSMGDHGLARGGQSGDSGTGSLEPSRREMTEKEKMAQALFGGLVSLPSEFVRPMWGAGGSKVGAVAFKSAVPHKSFNAVEKGSPGIAARGPKSSEGAVNLLEMDGANEMGTPKVSANTSTPLSSSCPPSRRGQTIAPSLFDFGDEANALHSKFKSIPPSETTAVLAPVSLHPSHLTSQGDPFAGLSGVAMQSSHSGTSGSSQFSLAGHKLHPLPINTEEFGARWTQMRFQFPALGTRTFCRELDVLAGAFQELGMNVVESIPRTAEVIAAGRLGAEGGIEVLLHAKFHKQTGITDCIVKCDNHDIARKLCERLVRALSK